MPLILIYDNYVQLNVDEHSNQDLINFHNEVNQHQDHQYHHRINRYLNVKMLLFDREHVRVKNIDQLHLHFDFLH